MQNVDLCDTTSAKKKYNVTQYRHCCRYLSGAQHKWALWRICDKVVSKKIDIVIGTDQNFEFHEYNLSSLSLFKCIAFVAFYANVCESTLLDQIGC